MNKYSTKNISICLLLLITSGCSSDTAITNEPAMTPASTADIVEEYDYSHGTIDADNVYSETIYSGFADYADCSVEIKFQLSMSEESSNITGLYIDNIEFVSLESLSGWDSVTFNGISSIIYLLNNQKVLVYWSYDGIVDGQKITHDDVNEISLYSLIY